MSQKPQVVEGSVTAPDLRGLFESDALSLDTKYKGYTLGRVQRYPAQAIGLQDGRRIFVDDTNGIDDPLNGVKATIDTVQGTVDPYLEREPNIEAAEKFLDTTLSWEYLSHTHERLQGGCVRR